MAPLLPTSRSWPQLRHVAPGPRARSAHLSSNYCKRSFGMPALSNRPNSQLHPNVVYHRKCCLWNQWRCGHQLRALSPSEYGVPSLRLYNAVLTLCPALRSRRLGLVALPGRFVDWPPLRGTDAETDPTQQPFVAPDCHVMLDWQPRQMLAPLFRRFGGKSIPRPQSKARPWREIGREMGRSCVARALTQDKTCRQTSPFACDLCAARHPAMQFNASTQFPS